MMTNQYLESTEFRKRFENRCQLVFHRTDGKESILSEIAIETKDIAV